MIYLSDLESYNAKLEKGIKKLSGYNEAFFLLGLISILASFALSGMLFIGVLEAIPKGANYSFHNIMTALAEESNQMFGYSVSGALFFSVILFILHSKMLSSQLKNYVEEIHPKIISEHKSIFADHSEEAIKAFREERDKVQLLKILKSYNNNVKFVIDNYNNFNINNEDR